MPGLLDAPLEELYYMVNLEVWRLRWTPDQVREFAWRELGLSDGAQFAPKDWINLCYRLRRL
jgi:hypothetical protein